MRRKAEAEVRAREKAKSLVAGEAMRARLGQGAKPKVHGRYFFPLSFADLLLD